MESELGFVADRLRMLRYARSFRYKGLISRRHSWHAGPKCMGEFLRRKRTRLVCMCGGFALLVVEHDKRSAIDSQTRAVSIPPSGWSVVTEGRVPHDNLAERARCQTASRLCYLVWRGRR